MVTTTVHRPKNIGRIIEKPRERVNARLVGDQAGVPFRRAAGQNERRSLPSARRIFLRTDRLYDVVV